MESEGGARSLLIHPLEGGAAMGATTHTQRDVSGLKQGIRAFLPAGLGLSGVAWQRRHHAILLLLWLLIPALLLFALVRGEAWDHLLRGVGATALLAVLATWPRSSHRLRALCASLGLVVAAAAFVDFSGGTIEAHFLFFVMIPVIALYQDWIPFLAAIAFVALHHGVLGTIAPHEVYNHHEAWDHPWQWAGIHAGLVLAETAAILIAWRYAEEDRARLDAERRRWTRHAALRAEVATALAASGAVDATLHRCAEALVRHLDASLVRIWLSDPATAALEPRASAGHDVRIAGAVAGIDRPHIVRIAEERRPYLTNDVAKDLHTDDLAWARQAGIVAFAGYPLLVDGRVVGVLELFARYPLPAGILETLAAVADVLAQGIERKRAEEAFGREYELIQTLLETLPDAVYVKDTASRFVRVNHATARELGVADPQDAIGKTDFDFFPAALAREFRADEQRLLEAGQSIVNKPESQTESSDGRWVLATKVPLKDGNGQVLGFVGINRDFTSEHRLQVEHDRLLGELENEFRHAAIVQTQLRPETSPNLPGYEFVGSCLPARHVGGDYFDWLDHEGSVRLSVGDVMGKGLPAALLTASVRASLRAVTHLPVSAAVEAVNRALTPDLAKSDSFITLFHAALEPESGRLTYVDAGHGMAFIQRRDGGVTPLRQQSLPLGVLVDASYPADSATLEPGDTLVAYSDGLPDTRPDLRLDLDGVAHQLGGLQGTHAKRERLLDLVSGVETPPDDITLVLVHRLASLSEPAESELTARGAA
jgi:PAS domain S-box-containing protein